MYEPDLVYAFDSVDDETGTTLLFEIDRKTNELYCNKQRVITEKDLKLDMSAKWVACILAISTTIIAVCNIITTIAQFCT